LKDAHGGGIDDIRVDGRDQPAFRLAARNRAHALRHMQQLVCQLSFAFRGEGFEVCGPRGGGRIPLAQEHALFLGLQLGVCRA